MEQKRGEKIRKTKEKRFYLQNKGEKNTQQMLKNDCVCWQCLCLCVCVCVNDNEHEMLFILFNI